MTTVVYHGNCYDGFGAAAGFTQAAAGPLSS